MREYFSYYKIFVQGGDAVATAWVAESRGEGMREEEGGREEEVEEKKNKSLWMEGKCKVGGILRELEALKIMQIRLPPQHAVNGTKRGLPDPAEIER